MTSQPKEVSVYLLQTTTIDDHTVSLGIYSSYEELAKGVEYWTKEDTYYQDYVFTYVEYELNYSPEPMGWDYAFIPHCKAESERIDAIKRGVSGYPISFGTNLIQQKIDDPKRELYREISTKEYNAVVHLEPTEIVSL